MNIEKYKLKTDFEIVPGGVKKEAEKLIRDFLILLVISVALAVTSEYTNNKNIEITSYFSFGLIFVVFILRLIFIMKKHSPNDCPSCNRPLDKLIKGNVTYILCNKCETIYKRFKRSSDPDKMFDEI